MARYGHQQISSILGRKPTALEAALFRRALVFWLEQDKLNPNA